TNERTRKLSVILGIILIILTVGTSVLTALAVNLKPVSAADENLLVFESAITFGTIALGEYPQTYVGNTLNETLKNANLTPTGHTYTTDVNGATTVLAEYNYNGKKVARLTSAAWTIGVSGSTRHNKFSDGTEIVNGATYYFYVEPIQFDLFLVNGQQVVAVAQNTLGSRAFGTNNDWSQSTLRTYLQNTFATESGLQDNIQAIQHYTTVGADDTAGTLVSDTVWLPSACEMYGFYLTGKAAQRPTTDMARATWLDDRGPLASNFGVGSVNFLRGKLGVNCLTALNGGTILTDAEHLAYNQNFFGFAPAFVLKASAVREVCQHDYVQESEDSDTGLVMYRCRICDECYYQENDSSGKYEHRIAIGLTSDAYHTNLQIRVRNDAIDALDIRYIIDKLCQGNGVPIGCSGTVTLNDENAGSIKTFKITRAKGSHIAIKGQASVQVYFEWFATGGENTDHYFIMRDNHIDDSVTCDDTVTQVAM
ncbi:MAG: DUF6273 domain-containing protein, partial [Prevotella sp.]|nr:DUF6273 domain-containing protein [Prevotella sp.]